ncbi:hypothetical protein [Spirulina sp. 06S082]|uniref:hypothetical protein n=1 Tax=Spirulina sp. 06S082 TaxID=3110248 RepID=UPI002B1F569A|nr:hypothetical protein [Spirulina sp. 06S082]MEA5471593.1 hypothetical protein [Spirulina sp. 06S082]
MQDKHKVTLYLPPDLHRRLKIKSAVDIESMSAMVEKAVLFYLQHPEVIEETQEQTQSLKSLTEKQKQGQKQGQNHQVYHCPDCRSPVVQRDGELISLKNQAGILVNEISQEISVEKVREQVREELNSHSESRGEETLVPC